MAATNYTPIILYHSTTASAAPTAGNLNNGELAINITDGKLFYKDNGGVVQVIATKGTGVIGGSDTQVQYNSSGALAGSANFTFNGTTASINTLNLTTALAAAYGGTGQSSYTTGDIIYATGATALSKLTIGANTTILTSNGSAPQWSAASAISVNTATNLAGGAAGSLPYQSGAGATTFLSIGSTNRVLTSSGSAPQWVTALSDLTGVSSNIATLGGSGFTLPAVLSVTAPAKLYINTSTVTDGSSAIGATNTLGAITSFGGTTVAATNANVTYTNLGTLVINAAPTAGTNVTITNPYALYVAAGASYFGSTVTVNGTVNATTLDLTNLEVTNIKAKDGTAAITLADSTGVATLSANPILNAGTANGVVYLNASKVATTGSALTFDGTNLGLGVTPSASTSFFKTLQIGTDAAKYSLFGQRVGGNAETFVGWNAYGGNNTSTAGTGFYYVNSSDLACMYSQTSGVHAWYTAPSGTAGNAITFTQAMTLDASGNLIVGRSTPVTQITFNGGDGITYQRSTDNTFSGVLDYMKSRGSAASPTAVQNGDDLFALRVAPYHGSAYTYLSSQVIQVDGTFTSGQNPPTRIAWYTNAANGSSTERARITSGGNLDLQKNIGLGGASATTSGTGITFPATQSASTDANTLDDYEEGTWTPTIEATSVNPSGISYSQQYGRYTKVGNVVYLSFRINFSFTNGTGSGAVAIRGIPFTPSNNPQPKATPQQDNITFTGFNYLDVAATQGNTWLEIGKNRSGSTASSVVIGDCSSSGTDINGGVYYFV
jgi:hypothetical protein